MLRAGRGHHTAKSGTSEEGINQAGALSDGRLAVQKEQSVDRLCAVAGETGSIRERGPEEPPENVTECVVLDAVLSPVAAKKAGGPAVLHAASGAPVSPKQQPVAPVVGSDVTPRPQGTLFTSMSV